MEVTALDIKKALAKKHVKDFFLTECKSGSTWMTPRGDMKILDGLAIRPSWTSPCFTGYEVKVSRGDFLRDAKFYTYEELVNCLYIVCPKGMIDRTELPESVGLMYYDPDKETITTRKKAIFRKIEYSPDLLLYIIYTRLDPDRIPFFSDKREYFEAYVAEKKYTHLLGRHVSSKLVRENLRLESELHKNSDFTASRNEYLAILEVLHKHGVWGWRSGGIVAELDAVLSRKPAADIADIRKDLERIVSRLQGMEALEEDLRAEKSSALDTILPPLAF